MVSIERITTANALVFKTARLRALKDTPNAFSSTYAKESQLSDPEWIERAQRWCGGERSIGFLATENGAACGLVASYFDEHDATKAYLVSMWTAPTHRRLGIGQRLVNEVIQWADSLGARSLFLMVTHANEPATRFYEKLGFTMTGRTEPYPNDPNMLEHEMSRPVP